MNIIIKENPQAFDLEGALLFTRQALKKPDTTFGIATGETTRVMYALVAKLHKELKVDYSLCKTCNLDEYVGIAAHDKHSCCYRINELLLHQINIKPENTYIPNGLSDPPVKELEVFKEKIAYFGGMDFLVLGIGTNGHIAFNEPGTPFDSNFHIAQLSEKTRIDKALFFGGRDQVPVFGITMGIRNIMMAREILAVAKGRDKAEAVRRIVQGPMMVDIPASALRIHPVITMLIDKEAASLL